jgi:hypothetical protein
VAGDSNIQINGPRLRESRWGYENAAMSALPPKADIKSLNLNDCFVPIADIVMCPVNAADGTALAMR